MESKRAVQEEEESVLLFFSFALKKSLIMKGGDTMKKYTYVLMCDSFDIDWCFEHFEGGQDAVAVFSSEEEAKAVATLRNASGKRRFGDEAAHYYVVRVPMYT